jgi:ABC-type multidrug transport system permease subunit
VRSFWVVLRKDLLRKLRSPLAPIIYLAFPVFFALLIGLTFGTRGDRIAPIRIGLVDEDGGLAARLLRSSFGQSNATERFEVKVADTMAEGMRLVENDKVSALVRIPPGFTDSLLSARPTHLEVVKNPAQGIYPQIAEEYVNVLALGSGSAVRVLAGPLQAIRGATKIDERPTDSFIANVSTAINHRMKGVTRYALPPAIRVQDVVPESTKKDDNSSPFKIALFVLPGMAVFSILMLAIGGMMDFPREMARGTLSRQLVAPVRTASVVLGKVAGSWVLGIICIVILAIVALAWARAGIGSAPGFVALSLAFTLAATGFAALVQSLSRSERTGAVVGSILVMVMSMVGGSWIPLENLPAAVRGLSRFTLVYWGAEGYRRLMFDGAGIGSLLPNIGILAVLGAVLCGIAVVMFRRRFEVGA